MRLPARSDSTVLARRAARVSAFLASSTHRKEWVRWIEEAKKPETRATRLARTVESLRAGKGAR